MKGLRKVLTPFAPDQSGAASVLYDLGGILVICDAGGCAGNICGFDEPRWADRKSAVFSAGLRDMDAIMGRDEKLVKKLADVSKKLDANFAAIIGTPVPAVIGTDFKALSKMAEKKTGLKVFSVATNGMRLYDEGEEEAYAELFRAVSEDVTTTQKGRIGVIGGVPMELGDLAEKDKICESLKKEGWNKIDFYGFGVSFEDVVRPAKQRKT